MGVDDLGGDTEPEPEVAFFAAGSVTAVETFKNLFFFGVRDAGTVIFHRKTDIFFHDRQGSGAQSLSAAYS